MKQGFSSIFLLIISLILVSAFVFHISNKKETSHSQQSTSQPKMPDKPGWTTYTDPEFGYSIQIPQEWREIEIPIEIGESTAYTRKIFRLWRPKPTPPAEYKPEAELIIDVTNQALLLNRRTDTDYQRAKKSFDNWRSATSGATLPTDIDWAHYEKTANVVLDNCDGVQILAQGEKSYSYSTYCFGKYIDTSIKLYVYDKADLNKYKPVYEEIVKSFKLNGLLGAKGDRKARDSVTKSDIKKIEIGLDEYYDRSTQKLYPVSLNDLVKAGILESIPTTMLGESYGYLRCTNGKEAKVFARIEERGTYWVLAGDTQSTQPPKCVERP